MSEEKTIQVPLGEPGRCTQIQIPSKIFSFFEHGADAIFLGLIVAGIIQAAGLIIAALILK